MLWGVFALILTRNLCTFEESREDLIVGVLNFEADYNGQRQALCWRDELFPLVNFTEFAAGGELYYEFAEGYSFTVERTSGRIEFKSSGDTLLPPRQCYMSRVLKPLRLRSRQLDRMLPLEPAALAQLPTMQQEPVDEPQVPPHERV